MRNAIEENPEGGDPTGECERAGRTPAAQCEVTTHSDSPVREQDMVGEIGPQVAPAPTAGLP